jgi:hypothetical protein
MYKFSSHKRGYLKTIGKSSLGWYFLIENLIVFLKKKIKKIKIKNQADECINCSYRNNKLCSVILIIW